MISPSYIKSSFPLLLWCYVDRRVTGLFEADTACADLSHICELHSWAVWSDTCFAPWLQHGFWTKGRVFFFWCLRREALRCLDKAVSSMPVHCSWCWTGALRWSLKEAGGRTGQEKGSKRSGTGAFRRCRRANLNIYVWFLAGSPENSFLIISLTVKEKRKEKKEGLPCKG